MTYSLVEFLIGMYYMFEMITKVFAYGFIMNSDSYLRNKWNILDFSIVLSIISYRFSSFYLQIDLGIFRNFVVLRLLRIKSFDIILERLYFVMKDLLKIYLFVFFVLITLSILNLHLLSGFLKYRCMSKLTGFIMVDEACGNYLCENEEICVNSLDNFDNGITNYDNIFSSFLQLLKIITFSNWTDSLFLIHKAFIRFAIFIFIILIVVGNFIILNLILAVLKVKYSEGVYKIQYSNKISQKLFDFKKIKKFTLMLGNKIDSNIFDNQITTNFMKSLYSLRFNHIKLRSYSQLKSDIQSKNRRLNFIEKLSQKISKFLCLNKKSSHTNIEILKHKHLELFVDFKVKYEPNSLLDVLLDK